MLGFVSEVSRTPVASWQMLATCWHCYWKDHSKSTDSHHCCYNIQISFKIHHKTTRQILNLCVAVPSPQGKTLSNEIIQKVAVFSFENCHKKSLFMADWPMSVASSYIWASKLIVILLTLFPGRRGSFTFEICVGGYQAVLKGNESKYPATVSVRCVHRLLFGITNWKIRKL